MVTTLFFLLVLSIPFNTGPTVKYVLSAIFLIFCVYSLKKNPVEPHLLQRLVKQPLLWAIGLYGLTSAISIAFSIDPGYSTIRFFDEFVLNLALFGSLTLFCYKTERSLLWFRLIIIANIIFLIIYLYVMFQWTVMPGHRIFADNRFGVRPTAIDIIFTYGNINSLVHGIKHTSFFLMLGIAITFVLFLWNRTRFTNGLVTTLNFITMITTTRRAPLLATIIGMGMTGFIRPGSSRKAIMVAVGALTAFLITGAVLYSTNHKRFFVREDWGKMLAGDIESQKGKGSIPIRILCIKAYSQEMMQHPFRGAGLGKRSIKEAFPEPVSQCGQTHPHNVFLNIFCEAGIQGLISLIFLITSQIWLFWKCFRRTTSEDVKIVMAAALIYMFMFWLAQMATYAFHHGTATLYWLFMAIPTGYALKEQMEAGE